MKFDRNFVRFMVFKRLLVIFENDLSYFLVVLNYSL